MPVFRVPPETKKKRTTALLSFLLPGLGQVYCGHYFRGLTLFAAFALLANFSEARLLLPLLAVLAATEAYRAYGKDHPLVEMFKPPAWAKPIFNRRDLLPKPLRLTAFSAVGFVGFFAWFALVTPWLFPFGAQMVINDQVEQLADGVRNFQALHGKYPEGLKEVGAATSVDPWGTAYELRAGEEGFEIRSWGRDRLSQTKDDLSYRFRR